MLATSGAVVNLQDGSFSGEESAVYVGEDATVNISGGEYSSTGKFAVVVYAGGALNISGGTLNAVSGNKTILSTSGTTKVTGGVFYGFEAWVEPQIDYLGGSLSLEGHSNPSGIMVGSYGTTINADTIPLPADYAFFDASGNQVSELVGEGNTPPVYQIRNKNVRTVTLRNNGGASNDQTVQVSLYSTYTLPECPFEAPDSKPYFAGWSVSGQSQKLQPGDEILIENDITIYANWAANRYTVTFDANGGSGTMDPVYILADGSCYYSLPKCSFTPPEGKKFYQWEVNDESHYANYTISGDITVKAKWISTYKTIVFDANGGEGTMADFLVPYDTVGYYLPANTYTKAGYYFVGWTKTANASQCDYRDQGNAHFTQEFKENPEPLILYAKWNECSSPEWRTKPSAKKH